MKFMGFKEGNKEGIGIISGEKLIELNCSMIEALNADKIENIEKIKIHDLMDVHICPPVKPSKIVCVGLN